MQLQNTIKNLLIRYQVQILIMLSLLLIGGGAVGLIKSFQKKTPSSVSLTTFQAPAATSASQTAQQLLPSQAAIKQIVVASPVGAPVQTAAAPSSLPIVYENNPTLVTKILTTLGLKKTAPPAASPTPSPTLIPTPSPTPTTIAAVSPSPTPTPSPSPTGPSITTGAPSMNLTNAQEISSQEKEKLLAILPFSNSQFSIKSDPVTYGIDVALASPADQSKIAFTNWLKQNHFDGIFSEVFSYTSL